MKEVKMIGLTAIDSEEREDEIQERFDTLSMAVEVLSHSSDGTCFWDIVEEIDDYVYDDE